jgi:hypothetical protein
LVWFLEQAGENPVDVEGLGVAGDAFGEATEERDQVGLLSRFRVEQLENGLAEAGQGERAETCAVPVETGRQEKASLDQLGLQGYQACLGGQRMTEPLPSGSAYGRGQAHGVDQPPAA